MGQWIDFKELRQALRLADVLAHYKVALTVKGDQAMGYCPLPTHNGQRRSQSFSVNLVRGIWQCFGGGAKGNTLDFAIRMEGKNPDDTQDVRAIALVMAERFGIATVKPPGRGGTQPPDAPNRDPPKRRAKQAQPTGQLALPSPATDAEPTTPTVLVNAPLDFELKGLDHDHPYLRNRGFTPETVRKFGLGYADRGLMVGRIAIPLRNSAGQLVGYAGRLVDESKVGDSSPKYRFPSRRERNSVVHEFRKSAILYNAERITAPVEHLVVVEGFPSVWWLDQAGLPNVVGLMGSSLSQEQAAIIVAKTKPSARILALVDGDKAGSRCALSVFEMAGRTRAVSWAALPDGKQPTDCSSNDLKRVLAS